MPPVERTPQGDLTRRRPSTEKVHRQLDDAFTAASRALDAVAEAAARDRLLAGVQRPDLADRFPAAGTGDMGGGPR